jgi:hypothetical protein
VNYSWSTAPRVDRRPGQAFGGREKESTYAYYNRTNRVLQLDSWLERRGFVVLSATRGMVDLRAQRKVATYFDGNAWHEHWIDFLAVMANKLRVGYIVKPHSLKAYGEHIKDCIVRTSPDWHLYMHEIKVVTEEEFNLAVVHNSENILIERRCYVESEYEEFVEDISTLNGVVMVHHLLRRSSSEAAARTALWNAIDRGLVVPVGPGRIKDTSYVKFVGQRKSA